MRRSIPIDRKKQISPDTQQQRLERGTQVERENLRLPCGGIDVPTGTVEQAPSIREHGRTDGDAGGQRHTNPRVAQPIGGGREAEDNGWGGVSALFAKQPEDQERQRQHDAIAQHAKRGRENKCTGKKIEIARRPGDRFGASAVEAEEYGSEE